MGTDVKKLSVSNSLLLRYARLSLNEISEKTGFPPLEAAQRISDLLDNRDWLSSLRQERLLIIDMQEVVQNARERLENADDENYAPIANVVFRGMKEIGVRMDARRKLVEADINAITAAHGRIFGKAFDVALWHVLDVLMEENPGIEASHVRELVREGMHMAEEKLEEYMSDE